MKQIKLLLASFLVLTLMSTHSVEALETNEVSVTTQDEFFEAFEAQVPGRTYIIANDIEFTKMNSKGTLTKDTFIKIPADSTIKGANDVTLTFNIEPFAQMTKMFSVLGNFTLENVSIVAPHKSNGTAHQYTQTLFAFTPAAKAVNFTNVNLHASETAVDVGGALHRNYGVALYFSNQNASVVLDTVKMPSGRFEFTKASSGTFLAKNSHFGQERFETLDPSDELIITRDGSVWEFVTQSEKGEATYSFNNDILHNGYDSSTYTEKLYALVGANFKASNTRFKNLLLEDNAQFNLEIEEGSVWNSVLVLDALRSVLSDEKYAFYKDVEFAIYNSDLNKGLKDGVAAKAGNYVLPVIFTGEQYGMMIPDSVHELGFTVKVNEKEKPVIKDPEVILGEDLNKEFGETKPVITFTPGSFDEPVNMDLKKSSLSQSVLDKAIEKINELLKNEKVGRTFTLDITALNANNDIVQANDGARITVSFPVPESLKGTKVFAVYYVSPNGDVTRHDTTVDEYGMVSFETSHFSDYLVAEVLTADAPVVPAEPQKPVTKPGVEVKKPVTTGLPATGIQSNSPVLFAIVSLGFLLIAVDQVVRYKKKIN